jgi:hypothetical protein
LCGPDCMSYSTQPAESQILSAQQKHCVALVALERAGRYVGALTNLARDAKADLARALQTTPKGG